MILEHFLLSINETNAYIVACSATAKAVIIDPGEWNEQIADFVSAHNLILESALITHGHHDHTGGLEELKRVVPGIQVASHPNGPKPDRVLSDGDIITVGQLKLKVHETPRHTDDSLTFVVGCDVFCGDLLFAGSIGGTDDRESFDREVQSIRQKILPLGDDMIVHPGHGPATTVGIERLFNPFLIT